LNEKSGKFLRLLRRHLLRTTRNMFNFVNKQIWFVFVFLTCSLGGGRWVRGMNGWLIDGSRFLIQSVVIFCRALRVWCRLGLAG
jgi:hypothetical protein